MLNHRQALLALRARLLGTRVAYTGATTLTATRNGFTRAAGSFVDEGFRVGMEVVPDGFADNAISLIRSVTATEMTVADGRTPEAAAAGRSLTVGIPLHRAWENERFTATAKAWYTEEDYLPGPTRRITLGPQGEIETAPVYVIRIHSPSGNSVGAIYAVADALLAQFPPQYAMTLADGTLLRVSSNPGPYRDQLIQRDHGNAVIIVTIPLWARTRNLI